LQDFPKFFIPLLENKTAEIINWLSTGCSGGSTSLISTEFLSEEFRLSGKVRRVFLFRAKDSYNWSSHRLRGREEKTTRIDIIN
jgi:hypothetical protein